MIRLLFCAISRRYRQQNCTAKDTKVWLKVQLTKCK